MIAGLLTRVYAGHENCSHVKRAHANAGQGWKEERRHVEVSSTSYRREYRSTTSELRVIICRRGSRLYAAFYHDTNTRARVITCVCLRKGGNIPDEKRERRSPGSEGFHSRLINWQITVNYRAGKLYKGYSIRLPLPLFFPGFSFALSVSVSPDSSASLYALHVAVDFSSRSSLVVFLLSVSDFFRPYTILSFHTWSSFIHLKSAFSPPRLPFLSPFTRLHQFFFLTIVLPSPPIYLLLFLRTVAPFPPVSLFSYATLFLSSQRYGRSRIQNAFSRGRSGGTHNYTYAPGLPASASPVRKTWKQVRYTQPRGERRAGRLRGTVPRRTCISQSRHSLPGHGGNNTRGIFLAFR